MKFDQRNGHMNTKSKLFALLLLVAAPFLLQSCDPVTVYEVYVDNRTADTLTVDFLSTDSTLFFFRDTTVLPGELKLLRLWEMRGKNKQYDCEPFKPGVTIFTPDGRTSIKDGTDQLQWNSVFTREAYRWQCFLQIKNEDLQ